MRIEILLLFNLKINTEKNVTNIFVQKFLSHYIVPIYFSKTFLSSSLINKKHSSVIS